MMSRISNNGSTYLLAALLLTLSLGHCRDILTESLETYIDDYTMRPEVKILQGTVRGVNMVTHHRRNFVGFKGIPFAQPPIGNLRFKAPLPPEAWDGILDTSSDSNQCPQVYENVVVGDEDCLYLHVYTPRLPVSENSTLLPVMFYVFGGRHKTGENNPTRWGPHFILDKEVVFVIPSYRLGVLGYLSTGDEVSPGNYGLKDLVRALEWNRDNVQYFGGDPNQVTLVGSSSGAMSVHLLTLSNLSQGLFHRYITQSGSALSFVAQLPKKVLVNYSTRIGEYLGCPTNTSTALLNCLMGLNASQLVDTESLFNGWYVFPQIVWAPTVEPDIDGAVLTDSPANLIANGKVRDLPWLSSISRNEGIIFSALFYNRPELFEEFLDKVDMVLPYILQYDSFVEDVTAYTDALKSYYLNDLTANRTLLLTNFTQLVGDALFIYPTYSANQKQLAHVKSLQYLCSFEYRGTFSYSYAISGSTEDHGTCHSDELFYLFQHPYYRFGPPGSQMNEADWEMVDTMVQLWTSFATTGTPTSVDPSNTPIWEPYSSRKNHLRIGNNSDISLGVEYNLLEERMQFWDKLSAATSWK